MACHSPGVTRRTKQQLAARTHRRHGADGAGRAERSGAVQPGRCPGAQLLGTRRGKGMAIAAAHLERAHGGWSGTSTVAVRWRATRCIRHLRGKGNVSADSTVEPNRIGRIGLTDAARGRVRRGRQQ